MVISTDMFCFLRQIFICICVCLFLGLFVCLFCVFVVAIVVFFLHLYCSIAIEHV